MPRVTVMGVPLLSLGGKRTHTVFPLKALHISILATPTTRSWDRERSSTSPRKVWRQSDSLSKR